MLFVSALYHLHLDSNLFTSFFPLSFSTLVLKHSIQKKDQMDEQGLEENQFENLEKHHSGIES